MTARKDGPSDEVRLRVFRRDRYICAYCGVSGSDAELQVDHIHPVSKGGSNHMSNLVTSCRSCNQKKGSGTLERQTTSVTQQSTCDFVGLWLHTWRGGQIEHQAHCARQIGDVVLVQLFSWLSGDPLNIVPMSPGDLLDQQKCTLYHSNEAMRYAYARYERMKEREQRIAQNNERLGAKAR